MLYISSTGQRRIVNRDQLTVLAEEHRLKRKQRKQRKQRRRDRLYEPRSIKTRPADSPEASRARRAFVHDGYQAYLKTTYWQNLRKKLCPQGSVCAGCLQAQEVLQLHHIFYRNLAQEGPNDLVRLCPICHDQLHEYLDTAYPNETTRGKARQSARVWSELFGISLKTALVRTKWLSYWNIQPASQKSASKKTRRQRPKKINGHVRYHKEAQQPKVGRNPRGTQPCLRCKISFAPAGHILCEQCESKVKQMQYRASQIGKKRTRRTHTTGCEPDTGLIHGQPERSHTPLRSLLMRTG